MTERSCAALSLEETFACASSANIDSSRLVMTGLTDSSYSNKAVSIAASTTAFL
jgi:hypothetical protein